MKNLILEKLGITEYSEEEITGLGTVNKVFTIRTPEGTYILRINDEDEKAIEYRKELWCIETVTKLEIPSPKVLNNGVCNGRCFMLQQEIPGVNGSAATAAEKLGIWRDLGVYAKVFHQVPRIEDNEVVDHEFHPTWKHRLHYNITALSEADSLLQKEVVSYQEHEAMKALLLRLEDKNFATGLVHGDLCPRNTIRDKENTFLIDWGTAEINIVPHIEIGIVLLSEEANQDEFAAFLEGLGINAAQFTSIEPEIRAISFLHHLDKYRWAEDHAADTIGDYEKMVISTFRQATLKSL